jgi:hypothetical protein
MKINWTEKALDEEEMHGKKCIESASTRNEAKQIFLKSALMTQPLLHSHYFVAWVDKKNIGSWS